MAANEHHREPFLILHTFDAKRGYTTSHPVAYREVGEQFVLAAINEAGKNIKPDWYLNLKLDPRVEIEIDGERKSALASTPTGRARSSIWHSICALGADVPPSIPRTVTGVLITAV
ncbi:MAG: deazaflavin-dependent oxidoreductase (nitroreductase family) [Candidatus Azotimanducaceae bacterium]|jgi:deazaflavin-dependent oxidoreductase (nitroreductase family)